MLFEEPSLRGARRQKGGLVAGQLGRALVTSEKSKVLQLARQVIRGLLGVLGERDPLGEILALDPVFRRAEQRTIEIPGRIQRRRDVLACDHEEAHIFGGSGLGVRNRTEIAVKNGRQALAGHTMPNAPSVPSAEQLLGNIADALAFLDLEGRIVYANDRLGELFGMSAESLSGRTWKDLLDADVAQRLNPSGWQHLECPEAHFNIDLPMASGALGTFCLTASPVRNEAGETIGVLENFRSMDKLRDMILDLREVNDAISARRNAPSGSSTSIADGVFTVDRASRRAVVVTGHGAADRHGRARRDRALRARKCSRARSATATARCAGRWSGAPSVERCHELFRARRTGPAGVDHDGVPAPTRGEDETLVAVVHDLSEIERLRRERR